MLGLPGILSDIGVETELAIGKKAIEINGKKLIVESALRADFALLHAELADHFGNLRYNATAQNFSPLMAMAADCTIVEAEQLVPLGQLSPNDIQTAGVFVDHVCELEAISQEYAVVRR